MSVKLKFMKNISNYDRVNNLIIMLVSKQKNQDVYLLGIEAIISIHGKDVWDENFDTFRKQIRKWMTDKQASPLLPKYIIEEYDFVVDNL